MREKLAHLEELGRRALLGGGESYAERHRRRGKLLPRERIELLLDRDAPFLELSPQAAAETEYEVGAGLVTGIGVVSGVECLILANDPTVRGGAIHPDTVGQTLRGCQIVPG